MRIFPVRQRLKKRCISFSFTKGCKVLFPASALGRKGAYEVRQLARDLGLALVVLDGACDDPAFWNGVNVVKTNGDPFDDIKLVVYPAYVEHQPRILLRAIASGIPVIATTACGVTGGEKVTLVPVGDYEVLKRAVSHALNDRVVKLIDR